ncbi:hypothetical protein H5410_025116 [Solanum commersonii]|uniref:Sulfotransferase n=1 Tax=Solanum commersonii TaxID=4109 RepID=A0A9J5YV04_SOLCO|nr:hypothetical protein H5410_025116 [Solanum commersonii]
MFDLYCKGMSVYGPFWDHVLDYWKQSIKNPNKVLFLMYEEIKKQPKMHLKRLAEFLECPFSIKEENCGVVDEILRMCSFKNLSNLEVNTSGKLSTGEENKSYQKKNGYHKLLQKGFGHHQDRLLHVNNNFKLKIVPYHPCYTS